MNSNRLCVTQKESTISSGSSSITQIVLYESITEKDWLFFNGTMSAVLQHCGMKASKKSQWNQWETGRGGRGSLLIINFVYPRFQLSLLLGFPLELTPVK